MNHAPHEKKQQAVRVVQRNEDELLSKKRSGSSALRESMQNGVLSAAAISALQRSHGNQFVLRMIQRDGTSTEPTASKPISANIEAAKHHVTVGDGIKKGVSGCHDMDEFRKYESSNQLAVTQETSTGYDGVFQFEYQLYKKDGSGELKAKKYLKTVYDPKKWSWERLSEVALTAAHDAHDNGSWAGSKWHGAGKEQDSTEVFGIQGYKSGNNAATFFFVE